MLQRLFQELCHFREVLAAKDSENERNAHDDEYALENVSKRNLKVWKRADAAVACEVEIKFTPECKVQRSGEDAGCRVEGGERY